MEEKRNKKQFFVWFGSLIFIIVFTILGFIYNYNKEIGEEIPLEKYEDVQRFCQLQFVKAECAEITKDKIITNGEYYDLIKTLSKKMDEDSQREGLEFKNSL